MKHTELIERLRGVVQKLRRTSMPIADVAPMVNEAADAIEALEAQMLQFRRDALGEAEALCRSLATTDCIDSNITRHECANAIQKLKDEK
jgi:predicted phage tail protein